MLVVELLHMKTSLTTGKDLIGKELNVTIHHEVCHAFPL